MGALQDLFTTKSSTDVSCASIYDKMINYETWNKYARENNAVEPSPVTIISLGRSEVNQVLSELGVVQRGGGRSVENIARINNSIPVSNTRRVPSVGATVKKPKIGLQPQNLTANDIQICIDGDIKYQEIMEMYGFTSERYFKEIIKPLGYRLLRGELWVVKDRLWLS